MGRILTNSKGLTLVELMVTVALSGISSLMLMTMLASYSEHVARAQNDSNLSEQLVSFGDVLDSYLGNATLIQSCGCANNCVFSTAAANETTDDCTTNGTCPSGTGSPILRFEYEDSGDAGLVAFGTCGFSGGFLPAAVPDGLVPRGCKRRARLTYTRPTTAAAGGQMGSLALTMEDAAGVPAIAPILQLTGVTYFRCGHPPDPVNPANPDTGAFKMSIRAKARANNYGPRDPRFDGWHPIDPLFAQGTHRSQKMDISFRNLNSAGIMFGKSSGEQNCTIDGAADPNGNCCSGYWDPGTKLCMEMTETAPGVGGCLRRGVAAASVTQCCSHMMLTAAGTCL
jgi:prepilin-type N-terminal cleavage/methylation domain-containing protein